MATRTHIAVIGAGFCGLGTLRELKDEGLEPTCFEKSGHYGGLWNYREGEASVLKTTICNTSKELGSISDFPPPKEYPNYLPQNMMLEYITLLAKEYDLLRHVKFHHEVTSVVPSDDYQETGKWVVSTNDTETGVISSEMFDGVLVCTGHHVCPNIPTFPGIETFQGRVLHTHSRKSNKGFEDQRVVVIGAGNSGVDAATDISSVAEQVYWSCYRGTWVMPRVGPKGRPIDLVLGSRFLHSLKAVVPHSFTCSTTQWYLNQRFNHSTYNLKPKNGIWSQHPTISDTLPVKILSGRVVVRRGIKAFVNNGVIFDGEEDITEVDTVILATGYRIKFPFLSEDIIRVENNRVNLYKFMFPPDLPHPSLVILGLIQPIGSGFPLGEMQGRWASMVMNGKCSLPSQKKMWKDIKKKEKANRKVFVDTPRHTLEVDYINYTDELATFIGAKPNFFKMAFTDPKLFWACVMGPSLPYQYRLQGPHPWEGARKAILTYKEREVAPLKGSKNKKSAEETQRKLVVP